MLTLLYYPGRSLRALKDCWENSRNFNKTIFFLFQGLFKGVVIFQEVFKAGAKNI